MVSLTEKLKRDQFAGSLSVKFMHGVWIVEDEKNVNFSFDSLSWQQLSLPSSSSYRPSPYVFFDGMQWILRLNQEVSYTYKEKGFFFSSTEERHYHRPQFYRAAQLGEEWERWDLACDFQNGFVSKGNLTSRNKVLIAAFEYDSTYHFNKYGEMDYSGLRIMYLRGTKEWQRADCPEKIIATDLNFWTWREQIFFATKSALYTSEKGFVWEKVEIKNFENCGEYKNILILFPDRADQVLLSADGKHFSELKLDKGEWTILAGHEESLLAIWRKNEHEVFLKKGTLHQHSE